MYYEQNITWNKLKISNAEKTKNILISKSNFNTQDSQVSFWDVQIDSFLFWSIILPYLTYSSPANPVQLPNPVKTE